MKLTITNNGSIAIPVTSEDDDITAIPPGQSAELDEGDTAIIGVKPNVREQFEEAFDTLGAAVKKLLEKWRHRTPQQRGATDDQQVSVQLQNTGDTSIRVILGDGKTDFELQPGDTQTASANGYVELRELGHAPQQGGTPDSSAGVHHNTARLDQ